MKFPAIVFALLFFSFQVKAQVAPIKSGKHFFSIQWISFNKVNPGTVIIKPIGDDEYSIEGEQRDTATNDYVTIKGTFSA